MEDFFESLKMIRRSSVGLYSTSVYSAFSDW